MTYRILLFIYRKPGMTPGEFKQHYENVHVPLMQKISGPYFPLTHTRRYIQRTRQPDSATEAKYPATVLSGSQKDFEYDAVSELTFEDEATCKASFTALNSQEIGNQVSEDCALFMDQTKTLMVLLDDYIQTPRQGG